MLPILEHAQDFLRSVQVLHRYNQTCAQIGGEPVFSVDVVNLSFGIELLLKALLCSEGLNARGHNHVELFQRLPDEMKKNIRDAYELRERSGFRSDPFDLGFHVRLKQYSGAFEAWRYIYEKKQRTFDSRFCDAFAYILNEMASIRANELRVLARETLS